MFTGIVARTVRVLRWQASGRARRLVLAARPEHSADGDALPWSDLVMGESIAVNGVCLTLVAGDQQQMAFDVVPETLSRSALEDLKPRSLVNLERALRVGDRLGGHYVLGHVDGIGRIARCDERQGETLLRCTVEAAGGPPGELPFQVVAKGSVTIDGVSLTVVAPEPGSFAVALVPHTLAVTNLGTRRPGDRVNLEMDHFGKWVRALTGADRTTREERD